MTTTSAPAAPRDASRMGVRAGAVHSVALAAACYVSYWLTTYALSQLHSLSAADNKLGGLWAVVATVFDTAPAITTTSLSASPEASPLS
jgi:hypothetical protein